MMIPKFWLAIGVAVAAVWSTTSKADWTDARCDIYLRGEDRAGKMIPCVFGQRQGSVTITRDDGITHSLTPVGDYPGNYRDEHGKPVYREAGLGRAGEIYRFADESVYVYWDTSALRPSADDPANPTAPYTTKDYDATTLLRCRAAGAAEAGTCPAGILRMEDGQASIVVTSPAGAEFTINFMTDYVNATGREVEANLKDDTWNLIVDGEETYEVPVAAIEGG